MGAYVDNERAAEGMTRERKVHIVLCCRDHRDRGTAGSLHHDAKLIVTTATAELHGVTRGLRRALSRWD